jgi:hypothetical protein
MKITTDTLERNSHGRYVPVLLSGNDRQKKRAAVSELLASFGDTRTILLEQHTLESLISHSTVAGAEEQKPGWLFTHQMNSTVHSNDSLLASSVGDKPAICLVDWIDFQDEEMLNTFMEILETGVVADEPLGKNVLFILGSDSEVNRSLAHDKWQTIVEDKCQTYHFAPVRPPKPSKMDAFANIVEAPDYAHSVFDEHIFSANLISNAVVYNSDKPQQHWAEHIERLQNLAEALNGVEGGIYGQQALSRGVDQSLIQSLRRVVQVVDRFQMHAAHEQFAELAQGLKALIFVEPPAEPIFKRVTSRSHDADYSA